MLLRDREPAAEPERRSSGPSPVARLRLLWQRRRFLFRAAAWGLFAATLLAFLIPKRYESTTRLMPPDDQSSSGMALLAALSGKMPRGLGGLAGDVLGLKSSGALFVGILRSRTAQDDLIQKFDLRKVYWQRGWDGARRILDSNTAISEDRKSGLITITVTDGNAQRAQAMAEEYVAELNLVVSQLNTSSAHRERVFLEGRLTQVKEDLEAAEKDFSQFASKNATIDIKEQGKAMVGAAASLQGALIAAGSELEGLKQIYTENNVRVRSLQARIAELHSQLDKLGGKQQIASDATSDTDGALYPSIRKLPLLGVSYADLYRRTQVQEAVFEALTQEYELAKVNEAKELPSVKVLDEANLPERKSFPPRLAIMFLGTFFCFTVATVVVLARLRWEETDSGAEGKIFAQEVFQTVNSHMPWTTPNGSRFQAAMHSAWIRLRRHDDSEKSTSGEQEKAAEERSSSFPK